MKHQQPLCSLLSLLQLLLSLSLCCF